MDGLIGLTEQQAEAVSIDQPRVLLVASAGSGKTEVLIRRIVRILSESAGEAFRVLAISYTVRAAEELRRRVQATVGEEAWRVDAETTHGFALDWLKRYGQAMGVDPSTVLLADDVDRTELLGEYLRSVGVGSSISDDLINSVAPILREIDRHRTLDPRCQFQRENRIFYGIELKELESAYLDALRSENAIDFPGVLQMLIEAVDSDPWIGDNFRSTYGHVLVDEGQDLSPAQADLLDALVGPPVQLFVVADDRQSINGFAGGAFENATRIVGSAAASPLHLPHNFRCATSIVEAAEAIAAHLGAAETEVSAVDHAPPGEIRFIEAANPQGQISCTVDWVSGLLEQGLDPAILAPGEDPNLLPEQIAVIARTRWVVQDVAEGLRSRGIETVMQADPGALVRSGEARVLVDLLALAASPEDRSARRRAVDELRENLGVDSIDGDIPDWLAANEDESFAQVGRLASAASTGEDLGKLLSEPDGLPETGDEWAEDRATLRGAWAEYLTTIRLQDCDLAGFLRHLSRMERTRPSDPGVRAMTIHKAKGLEFRAVAVIDARDGTIPHYRSSTQKELAEERRSLYVALTRAARSLLVVWPRSTVDRFGRVHTQAPSRFFSEADLI